MIKELMRQGTEPYYDTEEKKTSQNGTSTGYLWKDFDSPCMVVGLSFYTTTCMCTIRNVDEGDP